MTEITQAGGALAIRPDQTTWTDEQALVLKQSGIDQDVTRAELQGFLHLCQRTRLDPFSRQLYLIGRWDNRQKRKVFSPQTSIDGYRVIAHRAAAEAGHALGYEDTLWCAKDGRWRDVWLADEPPAAAKVTIIRNGMRFSAVARYSEYVQTAKSGGPSGLWGKMPATMTAKCAEALALRMAFPHDLAGVYTAEEMAQADNPAPDEPRVRTVMQQVQRAQQAPESQWETPAPAADSPPPGSDLLADALAATNAEAVRELYRRAAAINAPQEVLAQLAEVGRRLAEQAAPASEQPPAEPEPDVVDAEIVPDPTPEQAPADDGSQQLTDAQKRKLGAVFGEAGVKDKEGRLNFTSVLLGRAVQSWNDLTRREAAYLIDVFERALSTDDPGAALSDAMAAARERAGATA